MRTGRVDAREHLVPGAHRLVTVKQVAHRVHSQPLRLQEGFPSGYSGCFGFLPGSYRTLPLPIRSLFTVALMNESRTPTPANPRQPCCPTAPEAPRAAGAPGRRRTECRQLPRPRRRDGRAPAVVDDPGRGQGDDRPPRPSRPTTTRRATTTASATTATTSGSTSTTSSTAQLDARSSSTTTAHTTHQGELSHGRQDHLVRRPVEWPRDLGADPDHDRVGPAPRHQGARQPPDARRGC